MGYYDPPEDEPEFLGCPLCKHDEWVVQGEEEVCGNCGLKYTFADVHWNELYIAIPSLDPPPPDIDDDVWQPLSPEEEKLLEIAAYEDEQAQLKPDYLDEYGESANAYYRESDFQYDKWRETQRRRY
jgi:hypothetical protein